MDMTATAQRRYVGTVSCAIVALSIFACRRGDTDTVTPLPRELHGLKLVDSRTGGDAATLISHLHRASVSPSANYVGYYGPPDMRAVLYLSRFADTLTAQQQLMAMADRIGAGSSGFGHHGRFHVLGIEVHSVFGYDQIHYFFARECDVVWLGMPPPVARAGLADLLGVAVDSIPRMGAMGRIVA